MKNAEKYGIDPAQVIISGDSSGGMLAAYVVQELVKRPHLPKPHAQILISPLTQCLDFNLPSYQQNHFVPLIPRRVLLSFVMWYVSKNKTVLEFLQNGFFISNVLVRKYQKLICLDDSPEEWPMGGPVQETSPDTSPFQNINSLNKTLCDSTINPLLAEDDVFSRLPDTFILTCEFDLLRDDGLLYKKRLEDNGVHVSWCHLQDGFHGAFYFFNHWFLTFSCSGVGVDSILKYIKSL